MEISEIITPSLYCILPIALGWALISVVLGIRAGFEAGIRFFLFGLGILGAFFAFLTIIIFLPNWAVTTFVIILLGMPFLQSLRYLINNKTSGRLWMALPLKNEKLSLSLTKAAILVLLGLQNFITSDILLTPYKHHVLGVSLIVFGVFEVARRFRVTQIREKGILHETGNFYNWQNIESYIWKLGEDKLTLKLKKYIFKQAVNLKVLSHFRCDVLTYLSQNIESLGNDADKYLPFQKAG